jgi:hypothetical protein
VIEQVGAFGDQLRPVALDALDQRLDGFLAQLLGDLGAAAAEQAGGVGGVGVGALAAVDHEIEAVEHMLVDAGNAVAALFLGAFGSSLRHRGNSPPEGDTRS